MVHLGFLDHRHGSNRKYELIQATATPKITVSALTSASTFLWAGFMVLEQPCPHLRAGWFSSINISMLLEFQPILNY